MAARIEIKALGDPARQKEITDAVEALDGAIEAKMEKGALYVSYDPLATIEKKIDKRYPFYRNYCQSRSHRYRNCAS